MGLVFQDGSWIDDPEVEEDQTIHSFEVSSDLLAHEIYDCMNENNGRATIQKQSSGKFTVATTNHHAYQVALDKFYMKLMFEV